MMTYVRILRLGGQRAHPRYSPSMPGKNSSVGPVPIPPGWYPLDDEDAGACIYGVQDGTRCVWVDLDGLNVLHDLRKEGAQWAPLEAVAHVLSVVAEMS